MIAGPKQSNDRQRTSGLFSGELPRYFAASLVALAVDMTTFSLMLRVVGLAWAGAAVIGFLAGVLVAYWLSIRFVFASRTLARAPQAEFLSFMLIGVAGLGVTQVVLWLGIEWLVITPEISKLAAAGATFMFNFLVRRAALFCKRPVVANVASRP